MTWSEALLARAVQEGLYAQRKLDGDPSTIGPDDHEELQRIVSQGKRAESLLRREGSIEYVRGAYERAGVEYVEEGSQ